MFIGILGPFAFFIIKKKCYFDMLLGEAWHKINYTHNIQDKGCNKEIKYYKCYIVMNNNNVVINITQYSQHKIQYKLQ